MDFKRIFTFFFRDVHWCLMDFSRFSMDLLAIWWSFRDLMDQCGGFHGHGVSPSSLWLVYFMETSIRMDDVWWFRGYPHFKKASNGCVDSNEACSCKNAINLCGKAMITGLLGVQTQILFRSTHENQTKDISGLHGTIAAIKNQQFSWPYGDCTFWHVKFWDELTT